MAEESSLARHRARAHASLVPFWAAAVTAGVFLLVYVGLSGTGVLSPFASVVVDDLGQLVAGAVATLAFAWTALRADRRDRAWRVLLALACGGWTLGMAVWGWYQVFAGRELPSPSPADLGFFALPLFALPALLVFPSVPGTNMRGRRAPRSLLVTDTLVVVGSLFLLTWSTALGAALGARPESLPAFLTAMGYAVTDLVLVVFVVLLGTFRRPINPPALLLLGLGLVAFCVSDSFFLYLISTGAGSMPPLYNIGYVAGPVLTALAALVPTGDGREGLTGRGSEKAAVVLPCLPVVGMLLLLIGHLLAGVPVSRLQAVLGTVLVTLVVVRQLVTSLDNVALLQQVRDGQERLRRQAFTDPLTGLANRALFSERLAACVTAHRDRGVEFAVLFCDLDDFKRVNDDQGHAAGDLLLRHVAARLLECTGPGDTVARLGGDEFALLLPGGAARGRAVGTRVVEAVSRPIPLAGRQRTSLRTAASVGVVSVTAQDPAYSPDALLSRVDTAMYRAKNQGKNRLVTIGAGERLELTGAAVASSLLGDLRLALASPPSGEGRIGVVYQPIVTLDTESLAAVEALVRFDHALLGSTSPEDLVIAAEDAGLIGVLEAHVLDTACRDLTRLRAVPGHAHVRMHVNLSGRCAGDPELPERVATTLMRHSLPPGALVLEITETGRIPDLEAARTVLLQIRELGVLLALDDFGTGFSGVSYLVELPVDLLKLDRVLTSARPGTRAASIRDSAARMAADLGIVVVAEGVQSREEVAALMSIGCRYAQGYLYAPPGPLADIALRENGAGRRAITRRPDPSVPA